MMTYLQNSFTIFGATSPVKAPFSSQCISCAPRPISVFSSMAAIAINEIPGVEKVLCPPYISLMAIAAMLENTDIGLGAQDMHWEEKGAFTGEVAPNMVKEFCKYVIIGHSERRAYFGETDETVNRKLSTAIKFGLTPIVCVGETLDQYESGLTAEVVGRQIKFGLAGIDPVDSANTRRIIVAYEPVWAIGTGKASR